MVDDSLAAAAAAGYGSAAVSLFFLFSRNLLSDTFLARGMSVRNVHARDKKMPSLSARSLYERYTGFWFALCMQQVQVSV